MGSIAIVGEAWGVDEEKAQAPFVGASGRFLTSMLADAGISRYDCLLTNVFNFHPRGNDVNVLCGGRDDGIPGYRSHHGSRYIRTEFGAELDRLQAELESWGPTVIIALGNTPMWALLNKVGITKLRGYTDVATRLVPGVKVLPTYHPAAVIREYSLRTVTVLDFKKALAESAFPELRRPSRKIYLPDSIEDLHVYHREFIEPAARLSVDIETVGKQITCIGFAPGPDTALVVPFFDRRAKNRSYWPNIASERRAWTFVRDVCASPTPKTFQNGMYDIAFLYRSCGIRVRGAQDDTMLLHHSLLPESLKSLGFLGSVYTDEGPWKQFRTNVTTIKSDE